jgi:pimeloyl-ACP methyl ester carboxylesterase
VKAIGDQRVAVTTAAGNGALALYASRSLQSADMSDIERVVIVMHGKLRDADVYRRSAEKALRASPASVAHTLLIVPQFLDEQDAAAFALDAQVLRWHAQAWEGGDAAVGPVPISSYEAIDAVVAALADRRRFPKLRQVVIAGHSGGAQVVQRYAVVGEGEAQLASGHVAVRYVVANPSSYLYFNADRPQPGGGFAPPAAAACPAFNQWKYGWEGAPDYARRLSPAAYETRFAARDVVYLLGGDDTDPQHPALDKSCAGELEGPYRLARGRSYMDYLRLRHPGSTQTLHVVPGVGHDGDRMLGSACGLAALFDDAQAAAACR